MELIGAVVVFLLGAGVGLVLALYLLAARVAQDIAAQRATDAEQAEVDAALAEEREEERRAHLDATATIILEQMRLVGAALAAETREAAAQQRSDLRLAVGRRTMRAARRSASAPPARRSLRDGSAPPSCTPPAGTPATTRPTRAAPGVRRVGDDEATPPSGWSPEEVRARSQQEPEQTS